MKKLSLCMIVKNEERCLYRCLSSCARYVDEIIIVDTGSTDRTIEIAKEFNAKIYNYEWDDDFSKARNFSIKKSTGDFNLILDADEYITKFDTKSVSKLLKGNSIGKITRVDLFKSDDVLKKANCLISRIAPKNVFYDGAIHEQLGVNVNKTLVDIEIEHDGYLFNQENRFERNISIILSELKNNRSDPYMNYQAAQTYFVNKNYNEATPYFDKYIEYGNFKTDNYYKEAIINGIYNAIETSDYEKYLSVIEDNLDILNDQCDFWFACGVFFVNIVAFDTEKYLHLCESIPACYLNALDLGEPKYFVGVVGTGTFLPAKNLSNFYNLIGDKENAKKYNDLYDKLLNK